MTTRGTAVAGGMLLSMALLYGDPAGALELRDIKKAPAWYASETAQMDNNGKPIHTVSFGQKPIAFSPFAFNRILSAYGATVVNPKALPAKVGTEVVSKDKDGKDVRTVTFATKAIVLAPAEVDRILSAYGLRVADGARLPSSYGKEVTMKDKDGKQVVFSRSAFAAAPAHWHQVLAAYQP